MLKQLIYPLVTLVCSLISVFTLPYPLIQPFQTYRAFACSVAFHTNTLGTPFFMGQPFDGLLFHRIGKLHRFRLLLVALVRFTLGAFGHVLSSCPTSFSNVPVQFPTNSRGMNTNFLSNPF